MSAAIDTLSTAHDLEAAGFERVQAEAIASAIGRSGERAATKADLAPLTTKTEVEALATKEELSVVKAKVESLATKVESLATKAELSELETRLTTRFYGATIAIGGIVIASAKLL